MRFNYLKGTEYRHFSSFKKMKEFAKDKNNNGTYYISYPSMTIKKTREQIIAD